MGERHMQIGEVAERTSLSLRTIRYYGEVGLAAPSMRSPGGFRLYTEADVARLLLIKRMKPLDFSLDEMADLLRIMDTLAAPGGRGGCGTTRAAGRVRRGGGCTLYGAARSARRSRGLRGPAEENGPHHTTGYGPAAGSPRRRRYRVSRLPAARPRPFAHRRHRRIGR